MKRFFAAGLTMVAVSFATSALAEQCTSGVHALVPWSSVITGYAKDWAKNAEKLGFTVDKNPSGCTASDPCVLVYQPSYGSGIDKTYGHVAAFYGGTQIADSNGICKGTRTHCNSSPNFAKAVNVIHPKKKKK